eukprot:UN09841
MGLGLGGGLSGNAVMWVFAIILGIFGVIGGMILFIVSATKYGEINKEYISDVKSSVASQLSRLNAKYANIIRFSVLGTGNNIFKTKENADTAININIEIEIFTQGVQYIPDQNVIQQQPSMQLQAAAPQGQIIMVQMPDEVAPFAYNPGANYDVVDEPGNEEGGEGAKPTDGRYNYQ